MFTVNIIKGLCPERNDTHNLLIQGYFLEKYWTRYLFWLLTWWNLTGLALAHIVDLTQELFPVGHDLQNMERKHQERTPFVWNILPRKTLIFALWDLTSVYTMTKSPTKGATWPVHNLSTSCSFVDLKRCRAGRQGDREKNDSGWLEEGEVKKERDLSNQRYYYVILLILTKRRNTLVQ